MKPFILLTVALAACTRLAAANELQVSKAGTDARDGSADKPFLTISAAAAVAQPGDTITVHAGVYRERINPPRGGESDGKRIIYRAAPGETVEIAGSELVRNWTQVENDVWKTTLPNEFFGKYNPYSDLIRGDWFNPKGRQHHTGAVYLDGGWLSEAAKLEDLLHPGSAVNEKDLLNACWFSQVEAKQTTLWARFPGIDPNAHRTEINVRQSVFYPDQPGRNFITVRGFTLRDAATPWAPPTAEQIGLIGTNWSKGWIIEDNMITHSACSGVTLGKYGDKYDNTAESAEGYVKTVERALDEGGWSRERIGSHIVRRNTISQCEQTGICGSLGGIFSQIVDNDIHDIHVRQLFTGEEMAGIKLHASIDVLIQGNRIHHTYRGMWMDWMAQGTRITRNLCYDNRTQDLYAEVNHGPFLVDNNIFLSKENLLDRSEGGAYAQNLFGGLIRWQPDRKRVTLFLRPHSTALAGSDKIMDTDNRFYNDLFVRPGSAGAGVSGLAVYDAAKRPLQTGGNLYEGSAKPCVNEKDAVTVPGFEPAAKIVQDGAAVRLVMTVDDAMASAGRPLVTTGLLGKTDRSQCAYENPDGSPLTLEQDYLGLRRDAKGTCAGPFSTLRRGTVDLTIWPAASARKQ